MINLDSGSSTSVPRTINKIIEEANQELRNQISKVSGDVEAVSRDLVELQYQVADITIPSRTGLDGSEIDMIKVSIQTV